MKYVYLALLLMVSSVASADLIITPDTTPQWTTTDNSNLTAEELATLIGYGNPLTEYYKANVGGVDEKPFADSYDTTFANTASDPADFLITYLTGQPVIPCPDCFLLVKDGNNEPAQYVFDIGGWDGLMDISGTGFWADTQGAISHVSIFGYENGGNPPSAIPEPSLVALFGMGLMGMGLSQIRRKRKVS